MLTDLIYCYLLGENIIWWKKPKAADWPSGEVQLDFLIWLDIENFSVVLKMETEFKPLLSTDF